MEANVYSVRIIQYRYEKIQKDTRKVLGENI